MKEIIQRHYNELVVGLADLYIQKEAIDGQIKTQHTAIEQCKQLLNKAQEQEKAE